MSSVPCIDCDLLREGRPDMKFFEQIGPTETMRYHGRQSVTQRYRCKTCGARHTREDGVWD